MTHKTKTQGAIKYTVKQKQKNIGFIIHVWVGWISYCLGVYREYVQKCFCGANRQNG